MTQLASELNRRSTSFKWAVAEGPITGTLSVSGRRENELVGTEQFNVMMDGSGRWVMDINYGEDDDTHPFLDLGLPRGVSLRRVAQEAMQVITQLDELVDTRDADDSDPFPADSQQNASASQPREARTRRVSWITVFASIPMLIAVLVDFRLVFGAYLSLLSLIVSLTLLNRVDWQAKSGKWIAWVTTVISTVIILGHLAFLWNVLN